MDSLDHAERVLPVIIIALQLIARDIGKLRKQLLCARGNFKQPVIYIIIIIIIMKIETLTERDIIIITAAKNRK